MVYAFIVLIDFFECFGFRVVLILAAVWCFVGFLLFADFC